MKRLPIFTLTLFVTAGVLWMAGVPSQGQNTKGSAASDATKQGKSKASATKATDSSLRDSSDASTVFLQALQKLSRYKTIQASVVEDVTIGGRSFQATGVYKQGSSLQGADLKLRLEFQIRLGSDGKGDLQGELEQVSDGNILWTRQQIGKNTRVYRRNIHQILEAASTATGGQPQKSFVAQLGLGGIPALMTSIERTMRFTSIDEREVGGKTLIVVGGVWSDRFMQQILGVNPQAKPERLPDYFPDSFEIYFEKESLFPRRFHYLKKHPSRDISQSMVDIQFQKVELNRPIDDKVFVFQAPKGIFKEDTTKVYLDLLKPPVPTGTPPAPAKAP